MSAAPVRRANGSARGFYYLVTLKWVVKPEPRAVQLQPADLEPVVEEGPRNMEGTWQGEAEFGPGTTYAAAAQWAINTAIHNLITDESQRRSAIVLFFLLQPNDLEDSAPSQRLLLPGQF
jgi:hypothetical protein